MERVTVDGVEYFLFITRGRRRGTTPRGMTDVVLRRVDELEWVWQERFANREFDAMAKAGHDRLVRRILDRMPAQPDPSGQAPSETDELPAPAEEIEPTSSVPHPGEVLRTVFLEPLNISEQEFAKRLEVGREELRDILEGRGSVTPELARRLGAELGNSAEGWLRLQATWDSHASTGTQDTPSRTG